jgi:hypothetical protein
MANRNRNALNRAAYSAGLRHGVSIGIRAKAQHLTDVITAAPPTPRAAVRRIEAAATLVSNSWGAELMENLRAAGFTVAVRGGLAPSAHPFVVAAPARASRSST